MTSPATIRSTESTNDPAATSRRIEGSAAADAASAATVPRAAADHPGRWVGGALGAFLSLAAALVASRVEPASTDLGYLIPDWTRIGLLGIPIGFVLGRHLLPTARSDGWTVAIGAGIGLGLLSPPLGAIEVLATSGVLDAGTSTSPIGGLAMLMFLPIAVPLSFVAIVMTVPVGIAWAVLARLAPDRWLQSLRAPAWLAWLGIRHLLVLIVAEVAFMAVLRPDLLG